MSKKYREMGWERVKELKKKGKRQKVVTVLRLKAGGRDFRCRRKEPKSSFNHKLPQPTSVSQHAER